MKQRSLVGENAPDVVYHWFDSNRWTRAERPYVFYLVIRSMLFIRFQLYITDLIKQLGLR